VNAYRGLRAHDRLQWRPRIRAGGFRISGLHAEVARTRISVPRETGLGARKCSSFTSISFGSPAARLRLDCERTVPSSPAWVFRFFACEPAFVSHKMVACPFQILSDSDKPAHPQKMRLRCLTPPPLVCGFFCFLVRGWGGGVGWGVGVLCGVWVLEQRVPSRSFGKHSEERPEGQLDFWLIESRFRIQADLPYAARAKAKKECTISCPRLKKQSY